MAKHLPLGLLLSVASVLPPCASACKRNEEPSDTVASERARAAIDPFKSALKAELSQALAESPEKAVEVCSQRAPELARAASREGVVVGRASERFRNAANSPKAWLAPVIDDLSKAPSDGSASRVVRLPDGRRGYAEAIRVAPQCLVCHGEHLAPGVAAAIDARYPADRARGFKVGDFRGVFWAELDASTLR